MGYFFRKGLNFGPIRLNLSKSGVGASIGVKGARLTMTPRGTTYVTVGSKGFYYRETVARRSGGSSGPTPSQPSTPSPPSADEIATANVSDLVDSSSASLINSLNERAQMFNPAWVFYTFGVALAVGGFMMLSSLQTSPAGTPPLPEATSLLSVERNGNTVDDYPMLLERYGEPDSVLSGEVGPVAVGTARYSSENVNVIFVPNGCVPAYVEMMGSFPKSQGKIQTKPCAQPDTGWTIVGYKYSLDDVAITAETAKRLLDGIKVKRTSPPAVEIANGPKQKPKPGGFTRQPKHGRPELQLDPSAQALQGHLPEKFQQQTLDAEALQRNIEYRGGALFLGSLGLFVVGGVAHKQNAAKRMSRLFYELDEARTKKFSIIQQALTNLAQSQRIWRVDSDIENADWKRNAGASSLVSRTSISVGSYCPPRVQANIQVSCIDAGRLRLFFLPDLILIHQDGRFGSVSYDDFRVQQSSTRFIESGGVAGDATVVGRTWRYVNKNGGPDRRFNNNAQLPIVQYGVLVLGSSQGLNIHLQTSSLLQSIAFAACWRTFGGQSIGADQRREPNRPVVPPASSERDRACKVLGVESHATESEISAAYRQLAQMYHPDKVAGLAPEFQALAEARMKEINAAHEVLAARNRRGGAAGE
jgi:hypothetical protein